MQTIFNNMQPDAAMVYVDVRDVEGVGAAMCGTKHGLLASFGGLPCSPESHCHYLLHMLCTL